MLTLLQHTIPVKQHPFASLEALLDEPLPQSPEAMWHLEQRLAQASAQAADQILLVQLTHAHEDASCGARAQGLTHHLCAPRGRPPHRDRHALPPRGPAQMARTATPRAGCPR